MAKFVIIPDGCCDLTPELMTRFDIPETVNGTISFPNGEVKQAKSYWDLMTSKEFYESLKDKNNKYSTGTVSPEQFYETFKKYLEQGVDVLCITISSGLSGAYGFACQAAKELNEKYENKVMVIDSKRYSTAELLLISYAAEDRASGKSLEETAAHIEDVKNHLHQAGPMDDLKYLARCGRISNFKAVMGTLVGVNPIGEINKEGLTSVLVKVKGSRNALQTCVEYIKRTIINPEEQIIVIANTSREEKALLYKQMIEEQIKPKEIIFTEVGPLCAINIGPGLVGAYYYGNPISDDLSVEKAIFEELTAKK